MTSNDTLVRLVHFIDRLDWVGARDCFADIVDVDYSELSGEAAGSTPAEDLLGQWQSLLPGFLATQHLLGPVAVDTTGSTPIAHAHVRGWHYLPDSEPWVVAGHYEASLDANDRITPSRCGSSTWTVRKMRRSVRLRGRRRTRGHERPPIRRVRRRSASPSISKPG